MIEGKEIKIGGAPYMLPPLGLEGLKKAMEVQKRFTEMNESEQMEANIEIIHCALVRNYPELSLEKVREDIDADEIIGLPSVFAALYEKRGSNQNGVPKGETTRRRGLTRGRSAEAQKEQ
ncbi:MAG: hypothetical protein ABSF90_02525 [Syntrophobacteraceae bacterium]|jgi:hypothetical protein